MKIKRRILPLRLLFHAEFVLPHGGGMEIEMIIQNGRTVHLCGKDISYIMFTNDSGDLLNFYFGKKLADRDYSEMTDEWHEFYGSVTNMFQLEVYPQEYPSYGHPDLRNPAYQYVNKYGNMVSHLTVKEYKIHNGAVAEIKGMPGLLLNGGRADTLEVVLQDNAIELEVHLFYTVFEEYNIIARNAVIVNKAEVPCELVSAYSANVELARGDYDIVHFAGMWAREREMIRTPLKMGMKAVIDNARGGSGHHMNPFVMVAESGANEEYGEVYGFSLIYSGNHSTVAEVSQTGMLRVMQGINPHQFSWTLNPQEEFCTPQSVICYSDCGFGGISREYHDVYRNNLMCSSWTHKDRPILINNWEGTYFDFTEEKLIEMAKKAKQAGIELFVLDDGWFGERNDDLRGLGDWVVNTKKLPSGIDGLAGKINAEGMKFGLWFEPEMVNPDSDLFRAHPDWAVQTRQHTPAEQRHQLILDLSRDEVCEYVIDAVSRILSSANISYVKWDMNRYMTDMPCRGYNHKYTLGYYRIMSAITEAFPDVLFEGCSAGGGRFDPGVLAYMPQIWTSDNSDAIARLKIQYSTSMCYPVYSMGAHVTASPNHQVNRATSLKTRADVAYAGTFGYELDITKCTDEEFEEIKEQVRFDKSIRTLMRDGDMYRLQSPYETNYCSWEVAAKDKSRAFVFACKILAVASDVAPRIKLRGLDAQAQYRDKLSGKVYGGDMLMRRGIRMDFKAGDFQTATMLLERI